MQKNPDNIVIFLVITTCIILVLASFIITMIYLYRKRQIAYLKGLEQLKSEYEKNVLRNQIEIQEQTFQTLSKEIHDNINLSLTLAKLNLNTLDGADKENASEKINSSVEFISKAITDLTDISRSLNSDIIHEEGLITAVELEIEKLQKLKCFRVKHELTGTPVFMEAQKEIFIFRIIQESFNNSLKHAQAKAIQLSMHYATDHLEVSVTDDGVGFIPRHSEKNETGITASSGLRNMRKRTELLNGVFHITSSPGMGTVINFSIPY